MMNGDLLWRFHDWMSCLRREREGSGGEEVVEGEGGMEKMMRCVRP